MSAVHKSQDKWGPKPGQLEAVRSQLVEKHTGEEIDYTTCNQNGCFDCCLLKVHKKDGVITAIETDNLIHANAGREDAYVDFDEFRKGMYQHRACTRGRGWRKDVYSPNRIKYPMLRVGPRGSRQFKRISWDEALDLVAKKYLETREKYGPYSVWGDGLLGSCNDPFGPYFPGGGLGAWAVDSFEPHDFGDTFTFGYEMNAPGLMSGEWWGGSEAVTFFDSKLIILWGVDVFLNYPENAYYLLLAKERGIPLIVIEPRYTWTAHHADQWIPIRPGTDQPMMEAMAYVMFTEDLINKEFVDKWVEPYGLYRWKDYLLGNEDGVPKTPEWAEKICGVPAETIAELARLYGKSHPVYMRQVWAAARMHYGENVARTYDYLLAIGGNVGHKGTLGIGINFGMRPHMPLPIPSGDTGQQWGQYGAKNLMEAELWHHAIHMHEKLEAGEITEDEYKAEIGCPAGEPAPNIKMLMFLWNPRNLVANYYNVNARIEAIKKVDFFVYGAYTWVTSSTWYADLILPLAHQFFEGSVGTSAYMLGGYNFTNGFSPGVHNYFIGGGKIVDPPGEARPKLWIFKEIANRLGIGDLYAPVIKDVPYEAFDDCMRDLAGVQYNKWRELPEITPLNPPTWEEFQKEPIFRVPIDDYNVCMRDQFEKDIPLETPSGKIEFYSNFLATQDLTRVSTRSKTFGKGVISPISKYKRHPYSLLSPRVNKHPLYMITPHAFYRQHFCQDENPWFRDEYRPSVWISAVDAKARNIKDNDLVLVHNDVGQCMLPAYVTSRLTPGVCCMIFGRNYEPSEFKTDLMPEGIDRAGSCNILIPDEHFDARRGALLTNALVEISKADRSLPGIYDGDRAQIGGE